MSKLLSEISNNFYNKNQKKKNILKFLKSSLPHLYIEYNLKNNFMR